MREKPPQEAERRDEQRDGSDADEHDVSNDAEALAPARDFHEAESSQPDLPAGAIAAPPSPQRLAFIAGTTACSGPSVKSNVGLTHAARTRMTNILDDIRLHPKPLDTADWWKLQPPPSMAGALDDEEQSYLEFFTSADVPAELHIGRGIASAATLTSEEHETAKKYFGTDPAATGQFANYENRRRIIAHYTLTQPATVAYEMGLYRLTRDSFPPFFVMERVYEAVTGEEAFTGEQVSRLNAGVDLLIALVIGSVFKLVRVVPTAPEFTGSLTDPIWNLPPEGGGMRINGRWYTEHALERMAPDVPEVRAALRNRVAARLQRAGPEPNSPAWQPCFDRGVSKIDPRGIPPSVIEAEIQRPGSTNVKVITAKGRQVVVTAIPRH